MKARNKAKLAEDTSDLASEAESGKKRKRKLKKRLASSSEDDSVEIVNIAPPPMLKKTNAFLGTTAQAEKENCLPSEFT